MHLLRTPRDHGAGRARQNGKVGEWRSALPVVVVDGLRLPVLDGTVHRFARVLPRVVLRAAGVVRLEVVVSNRDFHPANLGKCEETEVRQSGHVKCDRSSTTCEPGRT